MLTTEQRKQAHYEMWMWCGRNPEKRKSDWPGLKDYKPEDYKNDSLCFACVEAIELKKHTQSNIRKCNHCPIDWGKINNTPHSKCSSRNALYDMWYFLYFTAKIYLKHNVSKEEIRKTLFKRSIIAFIIANKWR